MTWLAQAHPETAWAHLPTTEFPAWSARPGSIAILPVYGCADYGMGLPLNASEGLGDAILLPASAEAAGGCSPLVLPPLRFGPAPCPDSSWFGAPLDLAFDLVREISQGVKAAGFSKLLIYSACPWQREWLDAAARDARVETGMTVYRVHLGSLGLDFHPAAPHSIRLGTQALAACVLDLEPVASAPQRSGDENFRPGRWEQAPPLPGGPLGEARLEAAKLVQKQAAERLARLVVEAAWHKTGSLPPATRLVFASAPPPAWRPFGHRHLPGMTRNALTASALQPGAVAVLPTGAIEQHGPHLPVGVDSILGQGLLARALEKLPAATPVFTAAPLLVGKSNEHADWPGTLTLGARTFAALVRAQVTELHRLGFRRIAIFNTHGGNSPVLVPLIRELQNLPDLRIGMLQSDYRAAQSPQEATYGFHAGEWETSLMLALSPSLVRRARAVCHHPAQLDDAGELRPDGSALTLAWTSRDIAPQGVMGDATLATPSQGELWAEGTADSLAERLDLLTR